MKYARYFCGEFDRVISQEEKEREWAEILRILDCGGDRDTVDFAPIFDGKIYPTLCESMMAQDAAFGYQYDDDRRKLHP